MATVRRIYSVSDSDSDRIGHNADKEMKRERERHTQEINQKKEQLIMKKRKGTHGNRQIKCREKEPFPQDQDYWHHNRRI